MRVTGERGATSRPPTEAALHAMIERSQKEINEAQQQIHDLAYALFKAIDTQSQRLTVQSVYLSWLRDRKDRVWGG
jgi:hypothetical protein